MFSRFNSFGGNFSNFPQKFEDFFRCYPILMMNDRIRKDDANYGGKIFLPPSVLNKLTMLNIRYPMLFEVKSQETESITHGGVLEFIAEEGRVYLPQWMMETLGVQAGSLVQISSTDLPLGQFVKIEPQSVDFLDISDPKAVLENVLRKFSTLTVDDIIEINYNNKIYRIRILETKPESSARSICVIETDLVTDFAPPVGYVEPNSGSQPQDKRSQIQSHYIPTDLLGTMSKKICYSELLKSANKEESFLGQGYSLSGKSKINDENTQTIPLSLNGKPAPLILCDGQLFFGFPTIPPVKEASNNIQENIHFQSRGQSLRQTNKRKGNKEHDTSRYKLSKNPEIIEID